MSAATGEALLLEEEIQTFIPVRKCGLVRLTGPAGSGKTTALEHLAQFLAGANALFLDMPSAIDLSASSQNRWVIYTTTDANQSLPFTISYRLAPWCEDEWIEYLLAAHKDRCSSVMGRVRADAKRGLLNGNPQLWRIALDQMAKNETILSVRDALLQHLDEQFPTARKRTMGLMLGAILDNQNFAQLQENDQSDSFQLLRHRPMQLMLAGACILNDLQEQKDCKYFNRRFPRDLVEEVAIEIAQHPAALRRLRGWLTAPSMAAAWDAMAASILHAAGVGWSPEPGSGPTLAGAYLADAVWPGIALSHVDLRDADLSHADLRQANLDVALAAKADLSHATLMGASLVKIKAAQANLSGADLSACHAQGGFFDGANLEKADLQGGELREASFAGANLTGASFANADLRKARFALATLDNADFSNANLEEAVFSHAKLRRTCCRGASFRGAILEFCDLEEMDLPGADFRQANLERSLLTGSSIPDVRFDGARLVGAGLAEIDWERASLRGADLRESSFHMGSSRSGRVGSPIASEGSRTGFYTDDFTEQDFKAPEEIRKANLCHADLRGANIDNVDFYLVDLRHALFDPEQEAHLRRCGAILEERRAGLQE